VHTVPHTDYALINPGRSMMVVMDEAGYFDWIATAHNPRPDGCRKLQGSDDACRIRVGDYLVWNRE
jgi:hypothetical protein